MLEDVWNDYEHARSPEPLIHLKDLLGHELAPEVSDTFQGGKCINETVGDTMWFCMYVSAIARNMHWRIPSTPVNAWGTNGVVYCPPAHPEQSPWPQLVQYAPIVRPKSSKFRTIAAPGRESLSLAANHSRCSNFNQCHGPWALEVEAFQPKPSGTSPVSPERPVPQTSCDPNKVKPTGSNRHVRTRQRWKMVKGMLEA